jgi:hypothetical protein
MKTRITLALAVLCLSAAGQLPSGGSATISAVAVAPNPSQPFATGATSCTIVHNLNTTNVTPGLFQVWVGSGSGPWTQTSITNITGATSTQATLNFSATGGAGVCTMSGAGGIGPQGPTGPAGATGAQGPAGSASPGGVNGDVQCNASGSFGPCTNTGTGNNVRATSPTITTPTLSGNTVAGTINSTTIPSSATLATLAGPNAFTGLNDLSSGRFRFPSATFASPPSSPGTGDVYLFTDATAAGTCSGGGGSKSQCQWNGSAWVSIGGGSSGSGGNVVAGSSGKLSAITSSGTTTVDVVAGTVGGITDFNSWTGLNQFAMLGLPSGSALVTTDCDEAAEVGRAFVLTTAATGNKWHVCEQLTSGPATFGWRSQGGGIADGDKGDVTVSSGGTAWTVDTLPSSRVGLGNVPNYAACSSAQAIAGSASNCIMTPDVTAAAISASGSTDLFGETTFQQTEEFAGGSGSTTSIGSLGWSNTVSGTATTAVAVTGDRNHVGVFRFGLTSATTTGANVLWLGPTTAAPHFAGLQTTSGWEFRFRLRFPTSNQSPFTEAGTQYWIGLASMSGAGTINSTVPIDGFLAHFTSGANGPWSLETLKAGSADAAAQLSTSGNLAAGTWYDIRIRSLAGNDGTVLMSVNAGSGWETEKSFAVTSTANLAPVFMVQSTAATTTSGLPRQIDAEYYKVIESVVRP